MNFLPLYIGVELILGVGIINKLSGVYGILSLFTGHPLEFMQWIFYISSILCVVFYGVGLWTILDPKVRQFAAVVVIYSIDTLVSLFFIFWFAFEWFVNEDVKIEKVPGQDYSKSASQAYEYGWIILVTATVIVSRFYFNLVLVSFYKKLIKYKKNLGLPAIETDVDLNLKSQAKWKQLLYRFEFACYKLLTQLV